MSRPAWQVDPRGPGAWDGVAVCVAGLRLAGESAAAAVRGLGAEVTVVDDATGQEQRGRAGRLEPAGVRVRLGDAKSLPDGTDLLVVSPGFWPDSPLVAAAIQAGVPVWGDVELAWRLRPSPRTPWLCVTGTNGKTTTVQMLASIVRAAGYRCVAAGNVGLPLVDAVLADPPYDVLAVELSSFQLHYTATVSAHAATVLNLAPDHLDWHGSMQAYAADKAKIYRGEPHAVVNLDDEASRRLAAGKRNTQGFTLGAPPEGCLGIVDGHLVDRRGPDAVLAAVEDVQPAAPHNLANALAAAGLARALGCDSRFAVPPAAVRAGLRDFSPDAHRLARVATVDGVRYVDDSKATNAHAAAAALRSFPSVVWIAGGLAKGANFDELVAGTRDRLRGAVLLGRDRDRVRQALARHAPQVPVVEVGDVEDGAMDLVVSAAAGLAGEGDTVLLAPACASMDMFPNYAARGDAYAAAVQRLARTSRS